MLHCKILWKKKVWRSLPFCHLRQLQDQALITKWWCKSCLSSCSPVASVTQAETVSGYTSGYPGGGWWVSRSICMLLGQSDFNCQTGFQRVLFSWIGNGCFIGTAAWAAGLRESEFDKTLSSLGPGWGTQGQLSTRVPLWITVLALPCLMPPVFLHPELEQMRERWPAGSQQLAVMPDT